MHEFGWNTPGATSLWLSTSVWESLVIQNIFVFPHITVWDLRECLVGMINYLELQMLLLVKCNDRKKVKTLIDLTIIRVVWSGGWRTTKKSLYLEWVIWQISSNFQLRCDAMGAFDQPNSLQRNRRFGHCLWSGGQ